MKKQSGRDTRRSAPLESRDRILRWMTATFSLVSAAIFGTLTAWISHGLWMRMRLSYAGYDDEGYLLVSLKKFFEGLPLYSHTFTQYGPGFYWWQWASFHFAGLPVTHDSQRILSLLWMSATVAAQGLSVRLVSGSWLAAAAATYLLGRWIYPQVTEPGHPNTLILTLLSVLTFLYCVVKRGNLLAPGWLALGVTGAVLTATKPQLAFIVLLPVLLAESNGQTGRPAKLIRWAALAGAAIFPLLMMGQVLQGIAGYWAVCTLTLLALVLAESASTGEPPVQGSGFGLRYGGMALVLTGAGILAATLLHGTSWTALFEGMALRPAEFARIWFYPLRFRQVVAVSLISSVFVLGMYLVLRRRSPGASWLDDILLIARLAWTVLLLHALQAPDFVADSGLIGLAHAWCWLHLPWRKHAAEVRTSRQRRLLAWLAGLMTPYAFPVPGTQMILVFCFLIPLAAIVWGDAVERLLFRGNQDAASAPAWRRLAMASVNGAGAAFVLLAALMPNFPGADRREFETRPALRDPGSQTLRLETERAADYTFIAENIRGHCDSLFSVPGIHSFHFWSGVAPSHGWNLTAWMNLLRMQEQEAVARHLAGERACIVWSERWLKFWTRGADLRDGPIARAIQAGFEPWEESGEFALRMRRGHAPDVVYLLAGEASFDGATAFAVPAAKVLRKGIGQVSLQFRTRAVGTILSCQDSGAVSREATPQQFSLLLYVAADGRLHSSPPGAPALLLSYDRVDDGVWHTATLRWDPDELELTVDGVAMRASGGVGPAENLRYCLLGGGPSPASSISGRATDFFVGALRDVTASRAEQSTTGPIVATSPLANSRGRRASAKLELP